MMNDDITPQEFWKGFENPTQADLDRILQEVSPMPEGKGQMYRSFDSSAENAWAYAMAPMDVFDIGFIWGHHALNAEPPKSFLKFMLNRLQHERLSWHLKRHTDGGDMVQRYHRMINNHPWDKTPDIEVHDLRMNKVIQVSWKRKARVSVRGDERRKHKEAEERASVERKRKKMERKQKEMAERKEMKKQIDARWRRGYKKVLEQKVKAGLHRDWNRKKSPKDESRV